MTTKKAAIDKPFNLADFFTVPVAQAGKGKRFRKTFKTKGEAQRFEARCRAKVVENREWSPARQIRDG